jgi:hypothetical protein
MAYPASRRPLPSSNTPRPPEPSPHAPPRRPVVASLPGTITLDYLAQLAVLRASVRDVATPLDLPGSNSGIGNQGSANTAMLQGHAGTGLGQLSVPRDLQGGTMQ